MFVDVLFSNSNMLHIFINKMFFSVDLLSSLFFQKSTEFIDEG